MKVGDLVRYHYISDQNLVEVGIIIMVDFDHALSPVPYKVRWTDHADSERDWFREDELIKL